MDPNSKCVWAVQLPLGWMYNILSDVLETLNPEGIPRTRKGSCASLHHMYPVFAGPHPFLLPPLTQCIFMVLLSTECFDSPSVLHYSPLLGQRMLCTSSLRNWTDQRNQLYIAVPSPWLVSLPLSSWNSQTHTRLQNLELFTQSIFKRCLVFLSQRSTFLHWPMASKTNNT